MPMACTDGDLAAVMTASESKKMASKFKVYQIAPHPMLTGFLSLSTSSGCAVRLASVPLSPPPGTSRTTSACAHSSASARPRDMPCAAVRPAGGFSFSSIDRQTAKCKAQACISLESGQGD